MRLVLFRSRPSGNPFDFGFTSADNYPFIHSFMYLDRFWLMVRSSLATSELFSCLFVCLPDWAAGFHLIYQIIHQIYFVFLRKFHGDSIEFWSIPHDSVRISVISHRMFAFITFGDLNLLTLIISSSSSSPFLVNISVISVPFPVYQRWAIGL